MNSLQERTKNYSHQVSKKKKVLVQVEERSKEQGARSKKGKSKKKNEIHTE